MRSEKKLVSNEEAMKHNETSIEAGLPQGMMYAYFYYNDDGSIDEERTYRAEYRSENQSSKQSSKDEKEAASDRKKMKTANKKKGKGICSLSTCLIGLLGNFVDTDSIPFADKISDISDVSNITDLTDNI